MQKRQSKSGTSSDRKDRILSGLFHNKTELVVKLSIYRGLLSLFQTFVKMFQAEKPLMHKLHVEMYKVTREILGLFIKPDKIPDRVRDMMALDVSNREMQKSNRDLAVGRFAYVDLNKARLDKANHHWMDKLYTSLRAGYVKAATMLLKLPMNNSTLRELQVLDPALVRHNNTPRSLKRLAAKLPNVIGEAEQGQLAMEATQYSVDPDVKELADLFDDTKMRIDSDYWTKVFQLKVHEAPRFAVLKKLICALLSVFTGPLIEATFNIMDDIVEKDRASMTVENYEAIATVKRALTKKQVKAVTMTVTTDMKRSCINAFQTYKEHLIKKKQDLERRTEAKLQSAVIHMRLEKAKRISKLLKLQQLKRQRVQTTKQMNGMDKKRKATRQKATRQGRFKRIKMLE